MHYFIDGYNLLFRLMDAEDNLQAKREQIIIDLNQKAILANINLSIVFDAAYQVGIGGRSHFNHIEILFTSHGESADEYILEELKNSKNPRQETVVTSDKTLAWHARRFSAHSQSIEEFLSWMNKIHKKKSKEIKTDKKIESKIKKTVEVKKKINETIPLSEASTEQCLDYYERVFQERYAKILKEEKPKQKKARLVPPRQKKKKISPFDVEEPPSRAADEMSRWLKIFEEKSKET